MNNDGSTSRVARDDTPVASALPRGFTLGQLAAVLLGLTITGRVLGLVRQLVPARSR